MSVQDFLKRRPLFSCAAAFLSAALAADLLPPEALVLPAAALLFLLVLRRTRMFAPLVLAALFALVQHAAFAALEVKPVQSMAGQQLTLTVAVRSESPSYTADLSRGVLYVLDGADRNFRFYCENFPQTEAGEIFAGEFVLQLPEQDQYMLGNYADGVYLYGEYLDGYRWTGREDTLQSRLMQLQQNLSDLLRRNLSPELGALAAAMVAGDKTHLTSQTRQTFGLAGVSHLLVVSGLHLSIVCGLVWNRRSSRRKFFRLASVFCIAAALLLMFITGLTPSVCRAGIAVILFQIGLILRRPADPLTSLAAAALLLTFSNCYMVCDPGFQLSFSATLGVLTAGWLAGKSPPLPKTASIVKRGFRWTRDTVLTSFLASFFTLPVLLLQNMMVSGVSVLGNLLALPLMAPILWFGVAAVVCAGIPILQPLYYGFGAALGALLRVLLVLVEWTASLPGAQLRLPQRYALIVWLVMLLLGVAACRLHRPRFFALVASGCLLLACGTYAALQRDVVVLTLAGASNNPCLILQENGESVVFFRGGTSNMNAVLKALDEQPDLLIDIRLDPGEAFLQGDTVVHLAEIEQMDVLQDAEVESFCSAQGNLALIRVAEYGIVITAGQPQPLNDLTADLLVAGPSLPECVQARTVLSADRTPSWTAESPAERILYMDDTARVLLRPGVSVALEGASDAVQ